MRDILKNVQVRGKYRIELRDWVTDKLKERIEAENYIHPILFINHKNFGHGMQIVPSASTMPVKDGRDLIIDAAVLGAASIYDTASGGASTNPGTYLPADSVEEGLKNKYTFLFAPNQCNGTINSVFTGANSAGNTTTSARGRMFSTVPVDNVPLGGLTTDFTLGINNLAFTPK